MTRRARLYAEMLTVGAVLHGDRERLLGFDPSERPVACQLGGSEPGALAQAARLAESFGYDEINLNVGCPSDRVQNGAFGACLMLHPSLVGDCIRAMKDAVSVPVTVKCRIGVDDQDPEAALFTLAAEVIDAGVDAIIVHARKAWLKGLSPKENRDIPPLDYALVYRLKQEYPSTPIIINGGLNSLAAMTEQLRHVDGVMIGRAAYQDPALLLRVDEELFGDRPPFADAFEVVEAYLPYVEARLAQGDRLAAMTRHMLGLFNGMPGARAFRRRLAGEAVRRNAGVDVLLRAIDELRPRLKREDHAPATNMNSESSAA